MREFEKGDVVCITIPEPNVTNYGYHKYNYQLGIVVWVNASEAWSSINSCQVLIDFSEGVFEEFTLIKGMYDDHLTIISKGDFK